VVADSVSEIQAQSRNRNPVLPDVWKKVRGIGYGKRIKKQIKAWNRRAGE
jgi:hypothetical protein